MICNECEKECKYKDGGACSDCKHQEVFDMNTCSRCIKEDCMFEENKNESIQN